MNAQKKHLKNVARGGFALVESVVAVALFAMAAYYISTACYNFIYPFDVQDKPSQRENLIERAVQAITAVSDYDSLDDGVELESLDGETYTVYGIAEPTEILDLFSLEIKISGKGKDTVRKLFVLRPKWYQDSNERTDLARDRTDYLEDLRVKEDFNKRK